MAKHTQSTHRNATAITTRQPFLAVAGTRYNHPHKEQHCSQHANSHKWAKYCCFSHLLKSSHVPGLVTDVPQSWGKRLRLPLWCGDRETEQHTEREEKERQSHYPAIRKNYSAFNQIPGKRFGYLGITAKFAGPAHKAN